MGEAGTEPVVVQAGERRSARLEGVRAIAALGVLIGHVWGSYNNYDFVAANDGVIDRILFGGGLGVFLFFVLTGYLLFWPFVRRDFLGGAGVRLSTYARNRVLRIVPLYVISTAIVLVWLEDGGSLRQWLLFMTFSENFSLDTVGQVNGALWSVVVEIHFYLLLPLLAVVLRTITGRRWLPLVLVLGAAAAVTAVLAPSLADDRLYRFSIVSTFHFFVAGMLLAVLRGAMQEGRVRLPRALSHSDLWVLAAIPPVGWSMDNIRPEGMAIGGFLLVGAFALPLRHGLAARFVGTPVMAYLGVISYSIYVWQIPFLEKIWGEWGTDVVAILGIPVVLAVAWVSFRFIETPFLRLRRRWAPGSAPQESSSEPVELHRQDTPEPVAAG